MPSQTAGGRAGASPSRREPTALASAASAAGAASPALAANARRPAAAEAAERAPAVLHHAEPQLQRQRWPARDPSFASASSVEETVLDDRAPPPPRTPPRSLSPTPARLPRDDEARGWARSERDLPARRGQAGGRTAP